jgi:hypothetical protein
MHESEMNSLAHCADCGCEMAPEIERGFTAGPDTVLCYECAEKRGGTWDEGRGQWKAAPDLIGLEPQDPAEH